MEQINKINLEIDDIEKDNNIEKNTDNIKNIKEKIKLEQDNIDKLIEKVNQNKSKKYKKFKGLKIENLTDMYQNEENINEKIEIFQQINYLIENIKSQLFDEND